MSSTKRQTTRLPLIECAATFGQMPLGRTTGFSCIRGVRATNAPRMNRQSLPGDTARFGTRYVYAVGLRASHVIRSDAPWR